MISVRAVGYGQGSVGAWEWASQESLGFGGGGEGGEEQRRKDEETASGQLTGSFGRATWRTRSGAHDAPSGLRVFEHLFWNLSDGYAHGLGQESLRHCSADALRLSKASNSTRGSSGGHGAHEADDSHYACAVALHGQSQPQQVYIQWARPAPASSPGASTVRSAAGPARLPYGNQSACHVEAAASCCLGMPGRPVRDPGS